MGWALRDCDSRVTDFLVTDHILGGIQRKQRRSENERRCSIQSLNPAEASHFLTQGFNDSLNMKMIISAFGYSSDSTRTMGALE